MARADLLIVGGGTAGLVAAVGAASQGARVTLIERARTGGDCLWTGCVPSKALITAAAAAHTARHSDHLGVHAAGVEVDMAAVMAHVKQAIATIEPHDSPERLRSEGVEVVEAGARFTAPDTVTLDDGSTRAFRHALIATGSEPVLPPVEGLADADPLTNETLWDLTELPDRLVVLGGGPIGCELGQAFQRLGTQVTIVELEDRLLPREEPEASAVVGARLRAEGVDVRTATRAARVEPAGDGTSTVVVTGDAGEESISADRILVAAGRRPRTEGLGLDTAEVVLDERGAVAVDDRLQTSNPKIYAAGDVTMKLPFTHVAAAHGATVVQNALFGLRAQVDHERIPWVTFTSPEVARVGLSVAQARERFGDEVTVRRADHTDVDRAVATGTTDGFAMLVGDPKGCLVGATVVGPRAGETIGEVVAWITNGAKVSAIARSSTHAYPTWSDDVSAASLEALRDALGALKPASKVLLGARRALRR
ncbi:MAG: FAD-dependent oxidoreductase [Nitriliruptoraceae bacterium]|nr:FAD-dependent oxidoreductase [Nitriliruptoraceae bacterium]